MLVSYLIIVEMDLSHKLSTASGSKRVSKVTKDMVKLSSNHHNDNVNQDSDIDNYDDRNNDDDLDSNVKGNENVDDRNDDKRIYYHADHRDGSKDDDDDDDDSDDIPLPAPPLVIKKESKPRYNL